MMLPARIAFAATLLALATSGRAATVTFYLSYWDSNGQAAFTHIFNSPGQFTLYAQVSKNDNFGLASFGVNLTGAATLINDAPSAFYHDSRSDAGAPSANPDVSAGFPLIRQIYFDLPKMAVAASQDTVNGTGYFIEHFGQSSGNLINPLPQGWDSSYGDIQPTYYNLLKIAHGTYSNPSVGPTFVLRINGTPDSLANVFINDVQGLGIQRTTAATVQIVTSSNPIFGNPPFINLPPLDVPEPASIAFLAPPAVLLLRRRNPI